MELLILGGTAFAGRHLVEAALASGHRVTLFNRGQTNPDLFPQVEQLHGDRDGGLAVLEGRRWDAVVDTSGYLPRVVGDSARMLAGAVGLYTFISTISVYADWSAPGLDETAPVGTLPDSTVEEVTGETYGPLKALCEAAVQEALPQAALILRPGLIVGPHDPTDRFTYWVARIAHGGQVLAPGDPGTAVQFIDARDLASWILALISDGVTGVFNTTGPAHPLTLGDLLAACREASGSDATFTWLPEGFLLEREVQPWIQLPLWLPGPEYGGWARQSIAKALDHGLAFRPLLETVADTLAWARTRPHDHPWKAGLEAEKERELLRAWQERQTAET